MIEISRNDYEQRLASRARYNTVKSGVSYLMQLMLIDGTDQHYALQCCLDVQAMSSQPVRPFHFEIKMLIDQDDSRQKDSYLMDGDSYILDENDYSRIGYLLTIELNDYSGIPELSRDLLRNR